MSRPYNVLDVACFTINKHNELYPEKGITNLRLQKILYFIQRYFCRILNEPCFKQEMEAWKYGPVCKEVYSEFSIYSGNKIPNIESYSMLDEDTLLFKVIKYNENKITKDDKENIKKVIIACGDISDSNLVDISHNQIPWKNSYIEGEKNKIKIEDFYL